MFSWFRNWRTMREIKKYAKLARHLRHIELTKELTDVDKREGT